MKKYKNILLSLGSYVLALAVFIFWTYLVPTSPESPNWIGLAIFVILIVTGIFFGFKSNKSKESAWMGNILMLIGLLTIIYPFFAEKIVFILDSLR